MDIEEVPGGRDDWHLLMSFLPRKWRELAESTGALRGLRETNSAESLLRVLLIHLGCGHSLRHTAMSARQAQLAEFSSTALRKRLRSSRDWLRALCVELFRERGVELAVDGRLQARAIDSMTAWEPSQPGSQWRIHYSVQLPALACDYFKMTAKNGGGSGESWKDFPIRDGDYLLADQRYATAAGIAYAVQAGGRIAARVDSDALALRGADGAPFDLHGKVSVLETAGAERSWPVVLLSTQGRAVPGRVCAIRKTQEETRISLDRVLREAKRQGRKVKPQTLELARYLIVFTTLPAADFPGAEVLTWYRLRWQVELVFERFKQLAGLGPLPMRDDESAKAWLYGKLLVTLLVEKLIGHAIAGPTENSAWRHRRRHGSWREFRFMLTEVSRAIEPRLRLIEKISKSNEVSEEIADRPRPHPGRHE